MVVDAVRLRLLRSETQARVERALLPAHLASSSKLHFLKHAKSAVISSMHVIFLFLSFFVLIHSFASSWSPFFLVDLAASAHVERRFQRMLPAGQKTTPCTTDARSELCEGYFDPDAALSLHCAVRVTREACPHLTLVDT